MITILQKKLLHRNVSQFQQRSDLSSIKTPGSYSRHPLRRCVFYVK